jgi:hypothetical protein
LSWRLPPSLTIIRSISDGRYCKLRNNNI